MIKTVKDLEKELKSIAKTELYRFIGLAAPELCRLVKSGAGVRVYQEGYFCSNCDYKLDEEESWWHYCPNCQINYDCCEEEDEPCGTCGAEIERIVFEAYRKINQGQTKG